MAQVKTKAFYHAGERDEFGCRAIGRRYYEVRVSGKIDFDGNDYTDDEERADRPVRKAQRERLRRNVLRGRGGMVPARSLRRNRRGEDRLQGKLQRVEDRTVTRAAARFAR